jgi:hypothetical protein
MAVLSLTIPDAQVPRLVQAVAQQRGIDISAMTTPQKIAMMKTDLVNYWKGLMQASEEGAAAAAAIAAKRVDIDSNLTIT